MKLNDDNETVAAMDILVPKIGEMIGKQKIKKFYFAHFT
jgi:aspartyl/asparaginyl-tRNA synthetase